jgi:hypothetical protein
MPAKNPVTGSVQPVTARLSAAERRAAQVAAVANRQAELKQEAADRRRARELREDSAGEAKPPRRRSRPAS